MIEIVADFYLNEPLNYSLETLFQLAKVRSLRVLSAKTNKEVACFVIPWKVFRIFYGVNPRIGEYPSPAGAEKFISKVIVKKIVGV